METLGKRMARLREKLGLSQSDLARDVGIKPQSIQAIESGKAKGTKHVVAIARRLGVSPYYLQAGLEDEHTNVRPALGGSTMEVPIISWVQAGSFSEIIELPQNARETVVSSSRIGANSFALKVQGDSMAPEFTEGMIIICDPDMDALPGDYVVARNGDNEATFKRLVKDGTDYYLKPNNPQYPIKPLGKTEIIAVVREAVTRLR